MLTLKFTSGLNIKPGCIYKSPLLLPFLFFLMASGLVFLSGCSHTIPLINKNSDITYPTIKTRTILAGLDSLDAQIRLQSVKALGELKISSDNRQLCGSISGNTITIQVSIINKVGLRTKKIEPAIDALIISLNDIAPETKLEAAEALAKLHKEISDFMPAFSSLASLPAEPGNQEIGFLKENATKHLTAFIALHNKIVTGLSSHMNDRNAKMQTLSRKIVAEITKTKIPPLSVVDVAEAAPPKTKQVKKIVSKGDKTIQKPVTPVTTEKTDKTRPNTPVLESTPGTVEQLTAKLDSFDAETRRLAAITLGRIGEKPENEINSYLQELKNGDFQTRINAAKEIGDRASGVTGPVYALCRTLLDINTEVRKAAAAAIGDLVGRYSASLAEFKLATKDLEYVAKKQKDSFDSGLNQEIIGIKNETSDAEKKIRKLSNIALPKLILALEDENIEVRNCIANAITQISPDKDKQDKNHKNSIAEQEDAYRAYTGKPLEDDVPVLLLVNDLKGKDTTVARAAAKKLGAMGSAAASAVPALIHAIKDDSNWHHHYKYVRIESIKALGFIGYAAREAVPVLINAMDDFNVNIREEAARTLGQTGSYSDITLFALINALNDDPSSSVRAAAAEALTHCDPSCCLEEFYDALLGGLNHGSGNVRLNSFRALAEYEVKNNGNGFIKWKKTKNPPENYIVCTGTASDNLTECVDVGLSTICSMKHFPGIEKNNYVIDVTAKKGLVTYKIEWIHVDVTSILKQAAEKETDLKIKSEKNEALSILLNKLEDYKNNGTDIV